MCKKYQRDVRFIDLEEYTVPTFLSFLMKGIGNSTAGCYL
jgi:hypothetical protein